MRSFLWIQRITVSVSRKPFCRGWERKDQRFLVFYKNSNLNKAVRFNINKKWGWPKFSMLVACLICWLVNCQHFFFFLPQMWRGRAFPGPTQHVVLFSWNLCILKCTLSIDLMTLGSELLAQIPSPPSPPQILFHFMHCLAFISEL